MRPTSCSFDRAGPTASAWYRAAELIWVWHAIDMLRCAVSCDLDTSSYCCSAHQPLLPERVHVTEQVTPTVGMVCMWSVCKSRVVILGGASRSQVYMHHQPWFFQVSYTLQSLVTAARTRLTHPPLLSSVPLLKYAHMYTSSILPRKLITLPLQ